MSHTPATTNRAQPPSYLAANPSATSALGVLPSTRGFGYVAAPPRAITAGSRLSKARQFGHKLAIQRKTLPIQPIWQWIQDGGKTRKLNLKNNNDGTFTYSKTGDIFSPSGKTHTDGQPILNLTSSSGNATPAQQSSRNILFRTTKTGKIRYLPNTKADRKANAGKFLEMEPKDFAIFKGDSKRTASEKMMDPVTLKRFAFDESNQDVYKWDKSQPSGRGKKLSTKTASGGGKSQHQTMLDRIKNNELVDRRRKDRTKDPLRPFDIGTYKKKTDLPKTVLPLSGRQAWTAKGTDVNRDHVPSGESLNLRGDSSAYAEGLTIAIPNPEMHIPFSPTYGGKQKSWDFFGKNKTRRVDFDTDNPQAAAFRDTKHMLTNTANTDFSASDPTLDLTDGSNRARQIGGYRNLWRKNARINKKKGARRGFDPLAPAFDFNFDGKKSFTYSKVSKKRQGTLFKEEIEDNLRQSKKAKTI